MDVLTQTRRAARYNADRPAVDDGRRVVTFAEAWDRGCRLANGLLARGVPPRARVGVLEQNSIGAADSWLAMTAANMARVPLYSRSSRESHVHMLGHTGCRALVVDAALQDQVAGIEREVPSLEVVLVRDDSYEDWLAEQEADEPDVAVDPDDLVVIRHTGGSTGLPKGIPYTHRRWLDLMRDWFYGFPPVEPGDRNLHGGPLSHGSGHHFLPLWLHGGCNVMLPKFDAPAVLDHLRRDIAYMFMVPTMLSDVLALADGLGPDDFPALKAIYVAGAPISARTARRAHEVFGDTLFQGYGQTEAPFCTLMGPKEWFGEVEGSEPLLAAGRLLPYAELEVRGEDGREVPAGEVGEIALRSDAMMPGYWENQEATDRCLVDGWVLTGDVGRVDRNGYLYLLDRKGDVIISGGFNIYPGELEQVLAAHPAVDEVVVFAAPHERWGETPVAVCSVSGPVTAEALQELCAERLGTYKRPSIVELREQPLPRTAVGKIDRVALRDPYWTDGARGVHGS